MLCAKKEDTLYVQYSHSCSVVLVNFIAVGGEQPHVVNIPGSDHFPRYIKNKLKTPT